MRPRGSQTDDLQNQLFQSGLDQQLNLRHPLCLLAEKIELLYFDEQFDALYTEGVGRPGGPTRLMVGLQARWSVFTDYQVISRLFER
jgi:hypothetical protein